jgi:hypothetical protein
MAFLPRSSFDRYTVVLQPGDGTSITRDAFSYEREGEHKPRFTQEERRISYA